jgi:hypothetical protein
MWSPNQRLGPDTTKTKCFGLPNQRLGPNTTFFWFYPNHDPDQHKHQISQHRKWISKNSENRVS